MNIRKRICQALPAVFCLVLALLSFPQTALAADKETCTLTVHYLDERTPIPDAKFSLYRVAALKEKSEEYYEPEERFAESGAVLQRRMNNELWAEAANTLSAFADKNNLKADVSGKTDKDGLLTFSNLKPGLYLLSGSDTDGKEKSYHSNAACVVLPEKDKDGKLITKVTIEPKYDSQVNGIRVRKTVKGGGDKEKLWHFTVTLGDRGFSGSRGDMTFENGVAEFALRHGETAEAVGLPEGVSYTVEEAEANEDDYRTTSQNEKGVVEGIADVRFVNDLEREPLESETQAYHEPETQTEVEAPEKEPVSGGGGSGGSGGGKGPQTGDDLKMGVLMILAVLIVIFLAVGAAFLVKGKKNKNGNRLDRKDQQ